LVHIAKAVACADAVAPAPPPPSPITSERCRAPILHGNTTAPHKKMPSYKLPTERSPPVRHMFATLAFGEPGAVLE
jgi:hypothetical protein